MNKYILPTFLVLFFVFVSSVSAQSAEETATPTVTTSVTNRAAVLTQAAGRKSAILTQAASRKETAASRAAERKDKNEENRMENLRKRAVSEIDRRVQSMNALITKISGLKRLSEAQKSALTAQVQTEITNLTNLKAKIQADTDLATLQTDVKSIVLSYRIYALFMPKIHILTSAEGITTASGKMMTAYNELKTRVDAAKAARTDTSSMDASLLTMLAKINSATSEANTAATTVTPLTPDGYPGNKTTLRNAQQNIKTARENLREAGKLGRTILMELRKLSKITPTPDSQTTIQQSTDTPVTSEAPAVQE